MLRCRCAWVQGVESPTWSILGAQAPGLRFSRKHSTVACTIPVKKSVCTGHFQPKFRDASRPPLFFFHPPLFAMALNSRAFGTEITGNRGPNQELSKEARSSIISAVLAGTPKSQVARDHHVHRNTVNTTFKRLQHHQSLDSLPKSGCPTKFSSADKRKIIRYIRQDPKIKWKTLRRLIYQDGIDISFSALRHIIQASKLGYWRSSERPKLNEDSARRRYTHCRT